MDAILCDEPAWRGADGPGGQRRGQALPPGRVRGDEAAEVDDALVQRAPPARGGGTSLAVPRDGWTARRCPAMARAEAPCGARPDAAITGTDQLSRLRGVPRGETMTD